MNITSVAFFGSGSGQSGDPIYDAMRKCGALAAAAKIDILTGGYNGSGMGAPTNGARDEGGTVKGLVLSSIRIPGVANDPNEKLSVVINCFAESGRHSLETAYGYRLGRLATADAFVFAAGGGYSAYAALTLIVEMNLELWLNSNLNPKRKGEGKRISILAPPAAKEKARVSNDLLIYGPGALRIPKDVAPLIRVCSTPETAVKWVLRQVD